MGLLEKQDKIFLQEEFNKLANEVKINLFMSENDCIYCKDTKSILEEIAEISDKIKLSVFDMDKNKDIANKFKVERTPATILEGEKNNLVFYGIPAGYEFSSLIEDIIDLGNNDFDISEELKKFAETLDKDMNIKIFVTTSCPHCPKAVRTAHKLAMIAPNVRAEMIEAQEFPDLSSRYNVSAVPRVVINENTYFEGALPDQQYIEKIKEAI